MGYNVDTVFGGNLGCVIIRGRPTPVVVLASAVLNNRTTREGQQVKRAVWIYSCVLEELLHEVIVSHNELWMTSSLER